MRAGASLLKVNLHRAARRSDGRKLLGCTRPVELCRVGTGLGESPPRRALDLLSLAPSLTMAASPVPPGESDAIPRRPLRSKVPFVSSTAPEVPSEPQPSPEHSCSWWSTLTFGWVYGVMRVGYSRPLESYDLWRLSDERSAGVYAQHIIDAFERRKTPPRPPRHKAFWWRLHGRTYFEERQRGWTEAYEPSLLWAMNDAVFSWFWIGGLMRLVGACTYRPNGPLY